MATAGDSRNYAAAATKAKKNNVDAAVAVKETKGES
jgi:hypothetical protein